ncbi:MAG: Gfo/Idh/MocA family oxidoreductase [Chloroflexota bacterium]|nr:Gfo/Idh/MocA family oxidoreductase [Chloroflexota bacterium]MDE2919716.1 Gfo/Idh/MocA family oxidoreductase [Chloroflexota bacterium]
MRGARSIRGDRSDNGAVTNQQATYAATSPIRAAVVGPGTIGRIHVDALRRNGVDVVSVVGSTPERAHAAAAVLRVPHADASLAAALDRGLDAVHVCAPNALHRRLVLQAVEHGVHVVCEKPLGINVAEAADLASAAHAAGVIHAVCFNNRFYPLVQEISARRREGMLGRTFLVRASIADDTLWHRNDWDWRLDPTIGGPTVVTSTTGSHLLDLVMFLIGARPTALCATFGTAHRDRRPSGSDDAESTAPAGSARDDLAGLLVRLSDGTQAVLSLSHVAAGHPYRVQVEIDAEDAGVSWDSERPNELWIGHRDEPNELVVADPRHMSPDARRFVEKAGAYREGFDETFRLLFREVYADIADGNGTSAQYPTFGDGHRQLVVHEAIQTSVAERRWVDLDWSDVDRVA